MNNNKTKQFVSFIQTVSNLNEIPHKYALRTYFFMEISRAREEITPGPQKEGQTRSTLTFAKPQDHLHFQVSLTNDNDHNSSMYHMLLVD